MAELPLLGSVLTPSHPVTGTQAYTCVSFTSNDQEQLWHIAEEYRDIIDDEGVPEDKKNQTWATIAAKYYALHTGSNNVKKWDLNQLKLLWKNRQNSESQTQQHEGGDTRVVTAGDPMEQRDMLHLKPVNHVKGLHIQNQQHDGCETAASRPVRILKKPQFEPEVDTDIREKLSYVDKMRNANTSRKTESDMKVFQQFLSLNKEDREPHLMPAEELDAILGQFFLNVKKEDTGQEYEPDTLSGMQGSIHRHLRDKGYQCDIKHDIQFMGHRDILKAKRKFLKQQGKGSRKDKCHPFSDSEIDQMYSMGTLGIESPDALLCTLWFHFTTHFGTRGRQEHNTMTWGDVMLKHTAEGQKYLEFQDQERKKRKSQVGQKLTTFGPKIYEDADNPRCPVRVYLAYMSKRPLDTSSPESPFYLNPLVSWKKESLVWFSRMKVGKNKLGTFAKRMAREAELEGHQTNHRMKVSKNKLGTFAKIMAREAELEGHHTNHRAGRKCIQTQGEQGHLSLITSNTAVPSIWMAHTETDNRKWKYHRSAEAELSTSPQDFTATGRINLQEVAISDPGLLTLSLPTLQDNTSTDMMLNAFEGNNHAYGFNFAPSISKIEPEDTSENQDNGEIVVPTTSETASYAGSMVAVKTEKPDDDDKIQYHDFDAEEENKADKPGSSPPTKRRRLTDTESDDPDPWVSDNPKEYARTEHQKKMELMQAQLRLAKEEQDLVELKRTHAITLFNMQKNLIFKQIKHIENGHR